MIRTAILALCVGTMTALFCGSAGAAPSPAGDGVTVAVRINRPQLADRIYVDLTPPSFLFTVPPHARFEYEEFIPTHSAAFTAAINFRTDRGQLRKFVAADQNQVPLEASLDKQARGKWYRREFDISALAGGRLNEAYLAIIWPGRDNEKEKGPAPIVQLAQFRAIRILDETGKPAYDFTPRTGTLPFPLITTDTFAPDISVTAEDVVSAGFEPDRYLNSTDQDVPGVLLLHNFDADTTSEVSYALRFAGLDGAIDPAIPSVAKGKVKLAPGQTLKLPINWGHLNPGSYRPIIRLAADFPNVVSNKESARDVEGFAITVDKAAAIASRPAAFAPHGFAMGAVATLGSPIACIPALREIGANFFQVRISWSQVEIAPGQFDFKRVKPYLDAIQACGMKSEIDFFAGYPADTVPRWYQSDPMLTNLGRPVGPPFFPVPYWSATRQAGLQALAALSREYKDDPTVVAWNAYLGGESDAFYGMKHRRDGAHEILDYSESSQQAFSKYVRETMKLTLPAASDRYGLNLSSWSELRQPEPTVGKVDLRPIWADFMNYRLWTVGQAEQQASTTIEAAAPDARVEYLYGGSLDYLRVGNDYDLGVANAERYKGSIHHTASPTAETQAYLYTAWQKHNVPFTIETEGTPATVPIHQHAFYEMLRDGASGFGWIESGADLQRPTPQLGFGEYRAALERMYKASPITPPPALILSYSAQLVDVLDNGPTRQQQLLAKTLARRLEMVGYDYDLVTDRTPDVHWKDYPAVIDGDSSALSEQTSNDLAQYVRDGGKLVCFAGTGEFTPGDASKSFVLLKALGMNPNLEKQDEKGPTTAVFTDGVAKGAAIPLTFARPIGPLPVGTRIWASDREGHPAVVSWTVGRGQVLLWAGMPDWPSAQAFGNEKDKFVVHGVDAPNACFPTAFDFCLQELAQIKPPQTARCDDVMACIRRSGDDFFLTLFNASGEARSAVAPLPDGKAGRWFARDLTSGDDVRTETDSDASRRTAVVVNLLPYDVKVVQLSQQPVAPIELDFPRRIRKCSPPADSISGPALRDAIISTSRDEPPTPQQIPQLFDPIWSLPDDTTMELAVPAEGVYQVKFGMVGGESPAVRLLSPGTYALDWPASSDQTANSQTLEAVDIQDLTAAQFGANPALRLRLSRENHSPVRIAWVEATPTWKAVSPVHVSLPIHKAGQKRIAALKEAVPAAYLADPTGLSSEWANVNVDPNGLIDLTANDPNWTDEHMRYVAWTMDSATARDTLMRVGVDYHAKLWLNGSVVLDTTSLTRETMPSPDDFTINVRLKQGRNLFLCKAVPGSQGFSLWLRTIDNTGASQ